MSESRQREWLTDILESAPSIVFLALWRTGFDMESTGWIGVGLAALVLIAFWHLRIAYNPILLGINVHLIVITPLIVTTYRLGATEFADTLVAHSERGVLVTVFIVGCALAAFPGGALLGSEIGQPLAGGRIHPFSWHYRQRPSFGHSRIRVAPLLRSLCH